MTTVLITGGAGFIGHHLACALGGDINVLQLDSLNPSYGGTLPQDRLEAAPTNSKVFVGTLEGFTPSSLTSLVANVDLVVHLAAWAGVRASLERSAEYFRSNVLATQSILQACIESEVPIMIASSSSVYGDQGALSQCPEEVADGTGLRSPYAVSKWITEIWTRGLAPALPPALIVRPFSLYGPWGRPDMAYFAFARRMLREEPITLFGSANTRRDFTYIDDAIFYLSSLAQMMLDDYDGLAARLDAGLGIPTVNICNGQPASIADVIAALEESLSVEARIERLPSSELDLRGTFGDPSRLHEVCGVRQTSLSDGIEAFAEWMVDFRGSSRDW